MTEERQKARDQIFRAARQLSGDGPRWPRQVLAALAEEAGEEERGDSYGSGELIESFEAEIASILGKEAAVFLPSGTMAQQIALRIWTDRAGRRTVGWHPICHLDTHEEFGYRYLHALQSRHIGDAARLITLADLEAVPEPLGALLLELPQREIGGHLPSWEELQAQSEWAQSRGIALHMDGARLWESAPTRPMPTACTSTCRANPRHCLMRRQVAQADDITLFRWAWPASVPGWSTVEIAIGEAAATYTDAEAADAFRRVLERAGDQQCPQR